MKYTSNSILTHVSAKAGFALTAEGLKQMVDNGEDVTIIDVRNTIAYQIAHIPGAINIPAQLCSAKRLPPIGRVVVYGDDLYIGLIQQAVDSLNAKEGIFALMLEGGFSRWEALNYPTTRQNGLVEEGIPYITYEQLKTAVQNPEAVLVDISAQGESKKRLRNPITESTEEDSTLIDLTKEFPMAKIIQSPIDYENMKGKTDSNRFKGKDKANGNGHTDFYVLIDNGDGSSEDMARHMKASGIKRIFILTGGEETIKRKGKSEIKKTINKE